MFGNRVKGRIRIFTFCSLLLISLSVFASGQEWKGVGRVRGIVTDSETGEPIEGCKVKLLYQGGSGGPTLTTDSAGRWIASGLRGGQWSLDFTHPDYDTRLISVGFTQAKRMKPIEIRLDPVKQVVVDMGKMLPLEVIAAEDLYEAGKLEESIAAYREIVKNEVENSQYEIRLAELLVEHGDYEEASRIVVEALERDPTNSAALTIAGNAAYRSGNDQAAEGYYLKLTEKITRDAGIWANLAEISLNLEKYDQAQVAYTKAIELNPQFFNLYAQLAAVQMVANEYTKALDTLESLVVKAPADHPVFQVYSIDELIALCKMELAK